MLFMRVISSNGAILIPIPFFRTYGTFSSTLLSRRILLRISAKNTINLFILLAFSWLMNAICHLVPKRVNHCCGVWPSITETEITPLLLAVLLISRYPNSQFWKVEKLLNALDMREDKCAPCRPIRSPRHSCCSDLVVLMNCHITIGRIADIVMIIQKFGRFLKGAGHKIPYPNGISARKSSLDCVLANALRPMGKLSPKICAVKS